jgi:hypothetical protein
VPDWPKPQPEVSAEAAGNATLDADEPIRPWWRRSPALAACAAAAIGLGTLWFANMLGRVPLDADSTLEYLLMLPLLLIVPAFSAAGLRLSWIAARTRGHHRWIIGTVVLVAVAANGWAIASFVTALRRIFHL